jgi:hypothetical protein
MRIQRSAVMDRKRDWESKFRTPDLALSMSSNTAPGFCSETTLCTQRVLRFEGILPNRRERRDCRGS